ncbi:MAG TPA: hypothetical protein ENH82_01580 [bacterium]|nr:hypothetical protein [bacterium]
MNELAKEFRHYAFLLVDADQGYEWGKESPYGTDCSGTICYPLIKMGYYIRTTADELYRKIFTRLVSEKNELDLDRILAVFYVAKKSWTKLSGQKMPAGTVRHVTPVIGRYCVIDADWKRDWIIVKTAKEVRTRFESLGADAVWRELNVENTKKYSGKIFHSPDPEILDLLK